MLAMIVSERWNVDVGTTMAVDRRGFQPLALHFPFNGIPDQGGEVGAANNA